MNEDGVERDGGFRMIAWISGGKNLSSSLIALMSVWAVLECTYFSILYYMYSIECCVCYRIRGVIHPLHADIVTYCKLPNI
jgi:hypothetical protein